MKSSPSVRGTLGGVPYCDVAYGILALVLLASVAWEASQIRIATHSQESDYWEHAAALHELIAHPFRPQNPQLLSPASSPRFGPHYVVVALVAKLFGLDALGAMSLASVFNVGLLLAGIFYFFRSYFDDPLASLVGLIVMFGSWADAPHFSNVYKLSVLYSVAAYPSTAALGLALIGFALTLKVMRGPPRKAPLAGLAVFWAYTFATHQLTGLFALSGAAFLALGARELSFRRRILFTLLPLAAVVVALLWPYYPTLGLVFQGTAQQAKTGLTRADLGVVDRFQQTKTIVGILGLSLVGLVALPYFVVRRRHVFIVLGCLAMFVPFLLARVLPIPLGHRFILFAVFYLQLALVFVLLVLLGRAEGRVWLGHPIARWLGLLCGVGLLAYAGIGNVREARAKLKSFEPGVESPITTLAREVASLAGPNAVVLTSRKRSWALPAFGTKVVGLHHENPLVTDHERRLAAIDAFFEPEGSSRGRKQILKRYHVTHVLVKDRASELNDFLAARATAFPLPDGQLLFELRDRY